jgi:hypothetical protein
LHRGAAKCQAVPIAAPAGNSMHLGAVNCDPLPAGVIKCCGLRRFPILLALVPAPTGNGLNHGKRVNLGFTDSRNSQTQHKAAGQPNGWQAIP